ncbi:hypothetical protein KI387_014944, partial [Taxus chinensis]
MQLDDYSISAVAVDLAEFRPQDKVELAGGGMNKTTSVVTTGYLKLDNQLKKTKASLKKVEATTASRMVEVKAKENKINQLKKELKESCSKQTLAASEAEVATLTAKLAASEMQVNSITQERDNLRVQMKSSEDMVKSLTKQLETQSQKTGTVNL